MYSFSLKALGCLLLAGLALALSGCGARSASTASPYDPTTQCSGNYNGTWTGNLGGKAVLNTDCSLVLNFTGACACTGTYQAILGSFGNANVTITAVDGSSPCLSVGAHVCSYVFSASQMSLNCGLGDYVFYKTN